MNGGKDLKKNKLDWDYEEQEKFDQLYNAYSKQPFDLICSSFKFGYLQGMKAARAEIERGGRKNEK